jgi:pimeloyl-ACP methyl ester carboxylesterase
LIGLIICEKKMISKIVSFLTNAIYVIVLVFLVGFLTNKGLLLQQKGKLVAPGKFIQVNETTYHIFCQGPANTKYTIILEPDYYGSFVHMLPLFKDLIPTHRTCVYDRFNKGFTTTNNKTYSLEQELENLKMLLKKTEETQKFIFIGQGFGLKFAQQFAEKNKELVKAVVGEKSILKEEEKLQKLKFGLIGSIVGAFRLVDFTFFVLPEVPTFADPKDKEMLQHFLNVHTTWDQALQEYSSNLTLSSETKFLNLDSKSVLNFLKNQ